MTKVTCKYEYPCGTHWLLTAGILPGETPSRRRRNSSKIASARPSPRLSRRGKSTKLRRLAGHCVCLLVSRLYKMCKKMLYPHSLLSICLRVFYVCCFAVRSHYVVSHISCCIDYPPAKHCCTVSFGLSATYVCSHVLCRLLGCQIPRRLIMLVQLLGV